MDFLYLLKVLNKWKWLILTSSLIASIVTWYFTRNEPQKFLSTARISTGFAVPDEIKLNDKFTLFDAEVKFNNAISTMTSPSVLSLLSFELILHDLKSDKPFRNIQNKSKEPYFQNQTSKDETIRILEDKLSTMKVLNSYKPEEKKLIESLKLFGYGHKDLVKLVNIYNSPRTDFIVIDCVTENAELSAFISNTLFNQFIRYYSDVRGSQSQESLDTLRSIMNKNKAEFDQKNGLLRGEGFVDAASENTSKLGLMVDLEKTLTQEKGKLTENYSALRKINQRLASITTPGFQKEENNNEELVLARKAMNQAYADYLKTNDTEKLALYNRLKLDYNTKYSSSRVVNDKKPDQNNDFLQQKNDLEIDIESTKEIINSLEQKISLLKANVSALSTKSADIESMMEEVKLAEKEYLNSKQKFNDAVELNSSSVNNFRLIQSAQPAIEAEPSKRKLIIAMAGIVTLLSSIILIILITYLDSTVKTPNIFKKTVNLKLISLVNIMNLKKVNLKEIISGKNDVDDQKEKKRNNIFRESIRKLRYEIENSDKQIFLFTSTKKSQGKTTIIKALSHSLSVSKKNILVIDTNFSNNDLTVEMDADPILEEIDLQKIEYNNISEYLDSFSRSINDENVFAIGSKGGDYTPSEILPHQNLLNNLIHLRSKYDFIFLEGPPLNDFSDSKELVKYVDGVIAVFSATNVIKQNDKESIYFLESLKSKFIGSVLNKVDLNDVNTI